MLCECAVTYGMVWIVATGWDTSNQEYNVQFFVDMVADLLMRDQVCPALCIHVSLIVVFMQLVGVYTNAQQWSALFGVC